MATNILPPSKISRATSTTHQYNLPEVDRQAIIQRSSSQKKLMKIERKRLSFIGIHGHDGLEMPALNNENSL